jgi:hypothetical protein
MSDTSSNASWDSVDEFDDDLHVVNINDDLIITVVNAFVFKQMVLTNQITNYSKQRPINQDHIVKTLLPGIKKSKTVLGSILIAKHDDKKIIMNGQHRTETFKLMNEDELKEINVILEYRKVTNSKDLCKLYNDSNCHMLMSVEKLDNKHSELMDTITTEWTKFVRAKNKSVNKIDSRELLKKIQTTINFDFDKDEVMEILKKINTQYLDMCYESASNYSKKLKEEQWTKVVRTKFSLGIDSKFTFIDQVRKELLK